MFGASTRKMSNINGTLWYSLPDFTTVVHYLCNIQKLKEFVKQKLLFLSSFENRLSSLDIEDSSKSYERLPSQHSCSYKMRLEDIGRFLKCECIVTDVFGRSSDPAYAETGPILPGIFQLSDSI